MKPEDQLAFFKVGRTLFNEHPFQPDFVEKSKGLFDKLTKAFDKMYREIYPDYKLLGQIRYLNLETKEVNDKGHGNSMMWTIIRAPTHSCTETKRKKKE